ncbi:TonB-dependent siderophore receptor [Flavobacterium sp. 102]|uniref:TonB-dependent receptor plug domain-containing protein n=1 Tax=Flavobacterium sp. 102 TaxID=2135623 RepID=UPI000EB0B433|nr:TonB-dependent receptor [Flavobacterium sp. 102]RKS01227.1 iron complex outermembrane receptor protein [Flavobacterium sp. 102]
MKKIILLLLLNGFISYAQEAKDSLLPKDLKEVIVIGKKTQIHEKLTKSLATIDEFLDKGSKVDLVKRGAYAWEPIINSMATERTLITIDGMRIFGACTDKMDPITSYVEVSNLSQATVNSGQQGSCFGSTIGGAIDLKRTQSKFGTPNWNFALNTGFESNNRQKIIGSSVNFADSTYYFDTDIMFREAENYNAGNNREILYSQFRKLNFSGTTGFKFRQNQLIEASVIYDKATDVGYPALPMDVSLAEALITSLKYVILPKSPLLKDWETKIYFNTITHRMDDTTRPSVPIHMDMPGWSETFGMYSKISGLKNNHHFLANLNSFYNKSVAEMTMYPADPNENSMFMYTWPDVRTFFTGLFVEDNWVFNCHSGLKISVSIGSHTNEVASDFGLQSLQIFYPEMEAQKSRFLKSMAVNYNYNKNNWEYGFGGGYGERAPSVSEGYGFYLFNSSDRFDYIGNPNLKNEKSFESNIFFGYKKEKISTKITSSYFHITNYIIGTPDDILVPMTIGANGVKLYTALDYATIFNVDFNAEWTFSKKWKWNVNLLYSRGKDSNNNDLPLINPLSYKTALSYTQLKFNATLECVGNVTQNQFGAVYGETKTPDFALLNANFGYKFSFAGSKLYTKIGAENILDNYYTTYSDWNKIPRMGRNIFVNLTFSL